MPVTDDDLDAAADRYAASLPEALDLVHLGLGPDGHTASLVPGDPVLEVTDQRVAVTAGEYQGVRRMTLTYPELHRTRRLLWVVTGEEKVDALRKLIAQDPSIPSGRVQPGGESLILADRAAAPGRLVPSVLVVAAEPELSRAALVAPDRGPVEQEVVAHGGPRVPATWKRRCGRRRRPRACMRSGRAPRRRIPQGSFRISPPSPQRPEESLLRGRA